VNYLLDTNACIALINGSPPSVRAKFLDRGYKRICRDQSGRIISGLFMLVICEESQRSSATDFPEADSIGARRSVDPRSYAGGANGFCVKSKQSDISSEA
jgi:hypothetical protein